MTLQIDGVSAGYASTAVLRGVDLDVGPGELAAVLGASGSGKTTLLRVVAGLHRPSSGRVRIGGRDVTRVRPEHRRVGLVPQEGALFGHLDVAANVAFGLPRRRSAAARERVGAMLALVGLDGLERRMPHELSGGQRQRVALARALAPEPDLVLLDEPFSGLDALLRERLRADVAAVLRACGATAVLITHDRDEALSVADRLTVLDGGRALQTGTPDELYRFPADARVAGFVGEAALLPGTSDGRCVRTALGPLPHAPGPAGDVLAVLRPERLRLEPGDPDATVVASEFVGHSRLVTVELACGTHLRVREPAGPVRAPGDRVRLRADGPVHVVPGG